MEFLRDPQRVKMSLDRRIAHAKIRHGYPDWYRVVFNNFSAKLPCSTHGGEGYWAFICREVNTWENTQGEVMGIERLRASGHSELFIHSTGKQIKGMLDECLRETDVSPDHIRALRDAEAQSWMTAPMGQAKLLAWHYSIAALEASIPAFTLMIARGFNRYPDLVG